MNQNKSVDDLLQKGYQYLEQGKFSQAFEVFEHTDNSFLDDERIKYALGLTYLVQEQHKIIGFNSPDSQQLEQAIAYFDKAIQLQPNYLPALAKRGTVLGLLGKKELGLKDCDRVLKSKLETNQDWHSAGTVFFAMLQIEQALQCYEKALDIKSEDSESLLYKALCLEGLQQFDLAIATYQKTLRISPNKILALFNYGRLLTNLENNQEALECFDKSLRIKPNSCTVLFWRAIILDELNQLDDALKSINLALKASFNNAFCWSYKGRILGRLREKNKAVFCFNKALDIAPGFEIAIKEKKEFLLRELSSKDQKYIKLSQELLQADSDNIEQVLSNIYKILDDQLIEVLVLIADISDLQSIGQSETLREIIEGLKKSVEIPKPHQKYFDLSKELLHAFDTGGNREKVYSILAKNLNLLDVDLGNALKYWTVKLFPTFTNREKLFAANVLIDLSSYILEFPLGNKSNNVEIAIIGYQTVISLYSEQKFPREWAIAQSNISYAYWSRKTGDTKENLEQAIDACKLALKVFTEGKYPLDWARVQNNIGIMCLYRIEGIKRNNLEFALESLKNALKIRTEYTYPYEWAETQNNLGLVYSNRIEGDRKENIRLSINAFKNALRIREEHNIRLKVAETQNNLANVYLFEATNNRKENIETAIHYYLEAHKVYTESESPYMWAGVNTNLGIAYNIRQTGNPLENANSAISALKSALKVRKKKTFPYDWAETQMNLGLTYIKYPARNEQQKNIDRAIKALSSALEIYTRVDVPLRWAMIQHNLGLAYSKKTTEQEKGNVQKAIDYYFAALTVYSPQNNPLDCLITARNLGQLGFDKKDWQLAIQAYSSAIEAIETSRSWSTDDVRRQEIIYESGSVYEEIVRACINDGQLKQAIEYAERSRCRRLVDLMASNDLYNDGNIPPEVANYLEEYERLERCIDEEQDRISNNQNPNIKGVSVVNINQSLSRASFRPKNSEIAQLEAKKEKVWQKIRDFDRVLSEQIKVLPVAFDEICQLIPDSKTAIAYFHNTLNKLYVFVIFKNGAVKLHPTKFDLQEFLSFAVLSWFSSYLDEFTAWKRKIPQNLAELADNLNLSELVQNYLQDIEELIIIPHLHLHFLPFAALPINKASQELFIGNSQELLCDRFRIRTLPSAQILQFCHQRDSKAVSTVNYGLVEDADNSLPCSQYEGEQIAQIFNVPEANRLRGETQATVDKYRELIGRVQVLHSSHHAASRLDNPLESQLILADGRTISLGEIMSPGWRLPNLQDVFLSCCETNLGRTELSDDPLTIATGFLCAGARSVVSTLWSVDDLATAILTTIYYQLRKEGLDRPTALQQAQHKLRTMSGEEFKTKYDSTLGKHLRTQHSSIRQKKKEIQSELNNLETETDVSIEYKELKREFKQLKHKDELFSMQIRRFRSLTRKSLPFAHPFYWAGFISQGLR